MTTDYYSYLAVVSFDKDGISINFPDLPGCFTCAENEEEIFKMSHEVLGLHLWSMEKDSECIPNPSPLSALNLARNEYVIKVTVFMPPIRKRINNKVVKRFVLSRS